MSKFAYYITVDGSILGTNDKSLAQMYADCEDFFVVDSENGVWMLPNSETQDVRQVHYEEPSDDDSD